MRSVCLSVALSTSTTQLTLPEFLLGSDPERKSTIMLRGNRIPPRATDKAPSPKVVTCCRTGASKCSSIVDGYHHVPQSCSRSLHHRPPPRVEREIRPGMHKATRNCSPSHTGGKCASIGPSRRTWWWGLTSELRRSKAWKPKHGMF